MAGFKVEKSSFPIFTSTQVPRGFIASLVLGVSFVVFSSTNFAQDGQGFSPLEEAEMRYAKWDTRVADLKTIFVTSSSGLSAPENSFRLALLAKILWKFDQVEARDHLKWSADLFLSGLKTDDEKALETNLEYAPRTFNIIFELDEKYGIEVVGKLAPSFEDTISTSFRRNQKLAGLYAAIGIKVVNVNPKLAHAYGMSSLRHGFVPELKDLSVRLHLKDRTLAESLIRRAVTLSTGNYTEDNYLFAFHFQKIADSDLSTEVSRLVVKLFSDLLEGAAYFETERPRRCGIAFFAPSVAPNVDRHFPEQSPRFRQNIQTCIPHLHSSSQATTLAKSDMPNNVDELLKAGRDTKDKELKINYYREALLKLLEAKRFEEMISILEGFIGDEYQEFAPIAWGNWRVRAASGAAISSFEAGDIPSSFKFVNDTPKRLRPFVRKRVVSHDKVSKDSSTYIEHLNEMQKELESIDIPPHDAARLYLDLAEFYLKMTPIQAPIMFRNSAKFINKSDTENPDFLPEKDDWAPMENYVSLDAELLEVDDLAIFATLNEITSRRSRARLSLGLLESSLKKRKEAEDSLIDLQRKTKLAKKSETN